MSVLSMGSRIRKASLHDGASSEPSLTPCLALACALAALSSTDAAAAAPPATRTLTDKTLVVWAAPANLEQRGGSALTIEKPGGVFDAIVLGEIAPGKWMAGSDSFRRTAQDQAGAPLETTEPQTPVQIAIVYQDRQITLYRDGARFAQYTVDNLERFGPDSLILMGLRHRDAGNPKQRYFTGWIEDARVYAGALEPVQIAALQPNQPSEPAPWAWWDFENGRATDRVQTFTSTTLVGEARLADGKLHLDRPGAYLIAALPDADTDLATGGRRDPNSSARALREKLLADPHRPGFHFVIPEGTGMPFDPNGAIFWKGRYHLFYIFQDRRGHNWGHVSSTDLFHWRHHPTGLVNGMFSGNCFLNQEGIPTMCYHQVDQGNAMAIAVDDELNEWVKLDSNPITPRTQPGDPHHGKYRSWDPYGWLEGDTYYAIFGGEHPGLAKAPSLAGEWKYVGDFLAHTVPGISLNEDVSCADFFRLGDQHMLLCISHRLGCRYYLGEWKNEQFHPRFHEMMSWVDHTFFAPESLLDDRGRRIMWAWVFDYPGFKMRTDHGWSGTMSLPRVLSLDGAGRLRMEVPEEIERLRYNGRRLSRLSVPADADLPLETIRGNSLELRLAFGTSSARQFGVKVCCSPGGEEQTLVYYDAADQRLKVDTTRSSLLEGPRTVEAAPFTLAEGEPLELRVFVDKSVLEVFANGRQAVTRRMYPSRADSRGVRLFSTGASSTVTALEAWELMPSNPY
jgi:sucrose-6-phosphate hydrolase SacC (GH32 family)